MQAHIKTNKGTIKLNLFYDKTPITVSNFVNLAIRGYYNNLSFHRVINDFMVQGGCPIGTGTGGPGYNFSDEFHPELRHDQPGVLSMANAGPGTNGSQFLSQEQVDNVITRCKVREQYYEDNELVLDENELELLSSPLTNNKGGQKLMEGAIDKLMKMYHQQYSYGSNNTIRKRDLETAYYGKKSSSVWCKFYTPTDIVGYWKPDKFEEQIQIGDTIINNNDYVMADIDGVVIIPQSDVEGVLIESEKLINTENQVRKAIREGMDPQEAYLKYGAF